jgi:hypothetical protein
MAHSFLSNSKLVCVCDVVLCVLSLICSRPSFSLCCAPSIYSPQTDAHTHACNQLSLDTSGGTVQGAIDTRLQRKHRDQGAGRLVGERRRRRRAAAASIIPRWMK